MRALLYRASALAACAAFALPALAQDRPRNPANDPPIRQDERKKDDRPAPPVRDDGTGAKVGADKALRMSGKVVSVGDGQLVLRTDAGKEMTFYTNQQSRFMVDGRAARINDIRVGTMLNAGYVIDNNRYFLNTVTVGGDLPATNEGTLLEGTVVKVIGNDQVVIRAADGKEMTVYVTPETKYALSTQGGAFVDLQPNMQIRTWYDLRDTRATARAIRRGVVAPRRP